MNIACTQCGAKLEIRPDDEFLVCPYCESALYVDLGRTVVTKTAKPIIKEDTAVGSLEKLLAESEVFGFEIKSVRMVYIPYWQIEVRGKWRTYPACGLPVTALARPAIPQTTELLGSDEKPDAEELLPDIPLENLLNSLKEKGEIDSEPEKAALFKIPFYLIEYEHQGQNFAAYVDGVMGRVFYDDLPPSQSTKLDRNFGVIMGASFVALLAAALIVPNVWLRIITTGAAAGALYMVLKSWTGTE